MAFTTRSLGQNGPMVSAIGLGCMGMSEFYGEHDRKSSLATIAAALEAGITLFDTGDFYGMGHNEMLLAEALKGRRERAFLQVKFGPQRHPNGAFIGYDARPAAVKTALAYSLTRLNTDYVDLYQTGVDPNVPIEETIGAIGELVQTGYVRHIGIMNATAEMIRRAHATYPITALQFEYSLMSRDIENDILPLCRELGIGITAYGVLSRGLLTGSRADGKKDVRKALLPRFQGENLARNERLAQALAEVARDEGMTAAQAAMGWVASQGADIIPLVGARTVQRLQEAIAAPLDLPESTLAKLEAAIPKDAVEGSRLMAAT